MERQYTTTREDSKAIKCYFLEIKNIFILEENHKYILLRWSWVTLSIFKSNKTKFNNKARIASCWFILYWKFVRRIMEADLICEASGITFQTEITLSTVLRPRLQSDFDQNDNRVVSKFLRGLKIWESRDYEYNVYKHKCWKVHNVYMAKCPQMLDMFL